MTQMEVREFLDATLEDVALVLAGIFAYHQVPDEVVWEAMKHLDISHTKAAAQLEEEHSHEAAIEANDAQKKGTTKPHPALEALLRNFKLKRQR